MAQAMDTFGILHENLVDAGCDENTILTCMKYAEEDRWCACIPILMKYRKELLDAIHKEQEKLDCLDFLTYRIHKEHKG